MSLKSLFEIGRRILKGKKESATPATGQQQKLITYEGKTKETGLELAKKEMANPPVVLKKTKALHMGDDTAPAFGSSTYDWVMRKGPGKYSADEWIDHLTTTRKENFKVFGKPASRFIRGTKKFKYDRGPFAGKEATVSKEELFDTNLAIFNEAGDLESITMIKGEGNPPESAHEVDGLSGATITAKGVNKMLKEYLGCYQSFIKSKRGENEIAINLSE